jgi:predicted AlkP superfamily phosphohydrolase/phosphomutase
VRTVVLGLDAFSPFLFESLAGQGGLPHLSRLMVAGCYARFAVSNPPQSEVSWTSIATGLNPGGHGIFDFVHRNPQTYGLNASLLPTRRSAGGVQFARPYTARTIFDQAARQGFPAVSLWWPATFPARIESPVCTLPGLGTPDILGRLGVGTLFASDGQGQGRIGKTPVQCLVPRGTDRFVGQLEGPSRKTRHGARCSALSLELDLTGPDTARLHIGDEMLDLCVGRWSPIIELSFRLGFLVSVRAVTRLILTQTEPDVRLYALPLQIHPLHSPWRYGTPGAFVRRAWRACGPFLTLGMPQDTTGLEDGCISDEQFLTLCEDIHQAREDVLWHHLDAFREGVLASVFDSLDRIQHVFWRDRPDIVERWYAKLDDLVGRVNMRLSEMDGQPGRLLVVSDHSIAEFAYKVDLNRWLIEQGYLVPRETSAAGDLGDVDWARSTAYALGLNSLYLNLIGREGLGCVARERRDALLGELKCALLEWQGPDGRRVIRHVWRQEEAFSGPYAPDGPDLVIGYNTGYRASSQTGLGRWADEVLEANTDRWNCDHCMDPKVVPGVVFCTDGLGGLDQPSYRDFPQLAVGMVPEDHALPRQPFPRDEGDDEAVEERLRGLGYL